MLWLINLVLKFLLFFFLNLKCYARDVLSQFHCVREPGTGVIWRQLRIISNLDHLCLCWARIGWYQDSCPVIRIAVLCETAQILWALSLCSCSVSPAGCFYVKIVLLTTLSTAGRWKRLFPLLQLSVSSKSRSIGKVFEMPHAGVGWSLQPYHSHFNCVSFTLMNN